MKTQLLSCQISAGQTETVSWLPPHTLQSGETSSDTYILRERRGYNRMCQQYWIPSSSDTRVPVGSEVSVFSITLTDAIYKRVVTSLRTEGSSVSELAALA
ncbi:hypothetical protein RRG08_057186 [Elysia crispata]|uniref:Uncharacterized protein n=1 Tax=Elysia crispata TaxID=231223 RepID=A0AAE0XWG4_9GAST|nr:hypothetical protein RRG08_057186 [Elysia crispata]